MARLRPLLKSVLLLFLIICALWGTVRASILISQHLYRRRTEGLLTEIQSLELNRTTWQTAETKLSQWKAETKFHAPCNEEERCLEITLDDFLVSYLSNTTLPVRLDDYLRWRLKLSYNTGPFVRLAESIALRYMKIGGRLARITASVGTRGGVVSSKGFSVHIENNVGPFAADNARCEEGCIVGIMGSAASVEEIPRIERYAQQLSLHPTYVIDGPDGGLGWFGGISAGGVMFTLDASPADIHRFMQFDLSCLTRLHPCVTRGDLMPSTWKQHIAEMPPA